MDHTTTEEWEIRESQRQRELEEAKGRAQQMEKTMKWWSDCTSNWREKWVKVRNERNQAREEVKQLRSNLEGSVKEAHSYKREKKELEAQISQLKIEMEKIHLMLMKHAGQHKESERDISGSPVDQLSNDGLKNVNSEDGLVTKMRSFSENENSSEAGADAQGTVPKDVKPDQVDFEEKQLIHKLQSSKSEDAEDDHDYLTQKVKMLHLRLDDANKVIYSQKEENKHLMKELDDCRTKCEDLRTARQEAVRELLTMQETRHAEVRIMTNSLQEEINAREMVERRLSEMRTELERLQAENASEWAKRERLESDKINLERENKKIKAELMEAPSGRAAFSGMRQASVSNDTEVRLLQQELIEKNKEIAELKHGQSKAKKMLAEANVEMSHAVRRAEQYETEVKRLRLRVEELKKELNFAEDELDSALSAFKRLQRTNEELNARHSSPKNFGRGTNSPKIQEYRPNIHDLKQFFDENSQRPSVAPSKSSKAYGDARTSQLSSDDIVFEGKSRSDFERVKQKFDSRHSGKSSGAKNSSHKSDRHSSSSSQKLARSNEMNFDDCKNNMNIFESTHHYGADLRADKLDKLSYHNPLLAQVSLEKEENNCNFNLDGFKVSEDDDEDTS